MFTRDRRSANVFLAQLAKVGEAATWSKRTYKYIFRLLYLILYDAESGERLEGMINSESHGGRCGGL